MTTDWKDALSALRGDLPTDDTPLQEETAAPAPSPQQTTALHIVFDKKARKGKAATIVEGFTIPQDEVEALASELKKKLGCGGSCREGEILVQGDKREAVAQFLTAKGFKNRKL